MENEETMEINQEDIKSIAIGRFEKQSQKESYRRFMGTLVLMAIGMFIYEVNHLIGALIAFIPFVFLCFYLTAYQRRKNRYINHFLAVWNEQQEN